ncbi:SMP-30/gluconolactonase/LRE family protein [Mycolicibacterium hodleri]|nr:SMP-30/gluconolactonase/LRE family protein [Mycolicibacterium hodleri]
MAGQPAAHRDVELVAVSHDVIATWPIGTFLENIAVIGDDEFVVSVHNKAELHRATVDGRSHEWVSMPAPPAGMIVSDGVIVVGGEPGAGPHHVYRVTTGGRVEDLAPVPDTLFLNGFTSGPVGIGFTVDSILGVVIAIDLATGASRVVLRDDLLTKVSEEPMLPGANGIKAGDDALYLTNTDRALVLRAPLDASGMPVGTLDIVAENLRGDDLAVAANGDLFVTTHIHNTLIRLAPDGTRVAVAGPLQGMAGSTSCVFGRTPASRTSLFVTTTGGMVMPQDGVVQEAKLVRLDVGVAGRDG